LQSIGSIAKILVVGHPKPSYFTNAIIEEAKGLIPVLRPTLKKQLKEVFVCDQCGLRKRLKSDTRHWCDNCDRGAPVEMRPVRARRIVLFPKKTE